jgi:DNA helicase-2/ATP-dependent DNA helicase PcrA
MKNIFADLNPEQQEAVRETERPLLIIAGAGSGKTLTVASKIAYLIEAVRTEITEMASKIKAAAFEPKKGSWECNYCDYKCLCD